jgi:hypothetical protein
MAVQPRDSSEFFVLLEGHHLKRMPLEMKRALVLFASGVPREAIAERLGVSPATIKRWIDHGCGGWAAYPIGPALSGTIGVSSYHTLCEVGPPECSGSYPVLHSSAGTFYG